MPMACTRHDGTYEEDLPVEPPWGQDLPSISFTGTGGARTGKGNLLHLARQPHDVTPKALKRLQHGDVAFKVNWLADVGIGMQVVACSSVFSSQCPSATTPSRFHRCSAA